MPFLRRETGAPSATAPSGGARERPVSNAKTAKTYVAPGSKVTGEIAGSTEVLVDGEFEGTLNLSSSLVVGREGRVQAEVTARSVRIEGRVVGNVRGQDRVELMASGSLEGDISAARVVIAEGAFFKGNVEMKSGGKTPSNAPAAKDKGNQGNKGGQGKR